MKKNVFSFEEGKIISLDLFNKNLEKVLQDKQKIAFVKNLVREISGYFEIPQEELISSKNKDLRFVMPRHLLRTHLCNIGYPKDVVGKILFTSRICIYNSESVYNNEMENKTVYSLLFKHFLKQFNAKQK